MPFIAKTDAQRTEMLEAVGLNDIDDLFSEIPGKSRIDDLAIPDGKSEAEVYDELHRLSHIRAAGSKRCLATLSKWARMSGIPASPVMTLPA